MGVTMATLSDTPASFTFYMFLMQSQFPTHQNQNQFVHHQVFTTSDEFGSKTIKTEQKEKI
ncbi:hypothetical protein INR49_020618 [Caranx melampygus]|nr:hypothetical protein INR49_020618 [Caranx melampygus]